MGFIQDLIDQMLYEIGTLSATVLDGFGNNVFYLEDALDGILSVDVLHRLFQFMNLFAISLLILKVLQKGFWTYILWKDGDPDMPVQQTLTNTVLAVALVLSFGMMYDWFAGVCLWLIENLVFFQLMGLDFTQIITDALTGRGVILGVGGLIYFIMLFVLYLHFLKRSAELFLLRLGFPLACIGLLDSDGGVFTTTVKTFIQVALTTVAQLFCMVTSILIFVRTSGSIGGFLLAIAFCMMAFATPRMLQYILIATGGVGVGQKVTSALHTVSLVKGFLPHR